MNLKENIFCLIICIVACAYFYVDGDMFNFMVVLALELVNILLSLIIYFFKLKIKKLDEVKKEKL